MAKQRKGNGANSKLSCGQYMVGVQLIQKALLGKKEVEPHLLLTLDQAILLLFILCKKKSYRKLIYSLKWKSLAAMH